MFEEFKWFETFEWLWFQQSLCFQPDVALPLIVQPVNHSNSDVGVRLKGLKSPDKSGCRILHLKGYDFSSL